MISFIKICFWVSLFLVFYAYVGYVMLLYVIVRIKRIIKNKKLSNIDEAQLPEVTLMVAAYNEKDFIREKIENSFRLNYPKEKLKFLFVTDGSDDGTPDIISEFPEIRLLHQPQRQGKIAAVHRAMPFVTTPYVIFTDANTIVNENAVLNMVRHFTDAKVGAVAGEKRVISKTEDNASGAGEGFYWKYESALKKWDSELYSVVGAAGELFAIRTDLYEPIPQDTVIEDFYLTLRIAQKGFRVIYEPDAYASEGPSESVKEELKRKIRIAAGGIQAIIRLNTLLNPLKYGVLSFQYISHRVLRWTLAPLALPMILISNALLVLYGIPFYMVILMLQSGFYLSVYIGHLLEQRKIKVKAFFVPFYFFIMNYAVYQGFYRHVKGSQSVLWERARRAM
jgi:poly-beta-1,6-N-acetyl-D-glucosamine synthase